ncbi:uncharacterized protein Tco025E_07995 [Trypanosoma conorhini]|uniref:CFAP74 fourth Ig-like domain-containing protein n=1 Tax=Trypanosoma conorhini TaxID=83891 RepID=A0A3R7NL57_9TRYP|nr:uncharacterized protein Tco025E_07995 [Trypanosoma conorhini]RNF04244.1 hypothetical protein Tco025E_07995 [Trypanosoma conorhini]
MMEFLAYEDGTLRDERYRNVDAAEETLVKPKKAYHCESKRAASSLQSIEDVAQHDGFLGFIPSPKTVYFENFSVGTTYTMTVLLTNCANRSISFRVLPISIKYRDLLYIEYVPPPKISTGLSWKVQVKFTPEENVDLETAIGFRTEDGIFFVPVKAFRKRSCVSVVPECLDFGVVTFGEKSTKVLTLRNDGALAAKVFISGSLRKWTEVFHKDLQNGIDTPVLSITPVAYQLLVNPFSTCRLELTFSPNEEIRMDEEIELRYDSEGTTHIKSVSVKGSGGSLPVYISSASEIDFRWCFYENTYCEKILITNATNVSVTVVPEISPSLLSSVFFSPENACVQANDTFELYILFKPSRGLNSHVFSVIKMTVSGQASPISVALKAQLTERGFTLEPNKLNYGTSGMKEEIILPLKIRNLSDLPQTLGFLKLPENVHIKPFQTLTLLPKELFELKVGVLPPTLGHYTQVIKMTNEYGDSRSVQLTGCGRKNGMRFLRPCLSLPACPLGAEMNCTTVLENTGSTPQSFRLSLPNDILRVSPSSGVLSPGKSISIVVLFRPPEPQPAPVVVEENISRPSGKSSSKKRKERDNPNAVTGVRDQDPASVDALYKDWESNSVGEEWSRHSTFFVKCTSNTDREKFLILLQVNCTVVKPKLVARYLSRVVPKMVVRKELPKRNSKKSPPLRNIIEETPLVETSVIGTQLDIEFGEVPLKQISEKTCVLQYNGESFINLHVRPIDTLSPFRIAKLPPVKLSQDEECTMSIRFIPTEYGNFRDIMTIASTAANDITLVLSGICRPADLLIARESNIAGDRPQSIEQFLFDTVLVGQESSHSLYVHNLASLPVNVTAKLLSPAGEEPKWPEAYSFIIESDQFTIPANCKVSTRLIFCPRVVGNLCVCLHLSAGAYHHTILLQGRASAKSVFFTFPEQITQLTEPSSLLCTGLQSDVFPVEGPSAAYPIQVLCAPEETKTIIVGGVKQGANFECTVTGWSDSYLENGWKLDPMKVTVPSGGQVVFSLTYNPKRELGDVSFCTFSLITKSSEALAETQCHVRCTGTMKL